MTRKDYVKLAKMLHDARVDRSHYPPGSTENLALSYMLCRIEDSLVDILADDNPNFDEARFRDAAK